MNADRDAGLFARCLLALMIQHLRGLGGKALIYTQTLEFQKEHTIRNRIKGFAVRPVVGLSLD